MYRSLYDDNALLRAERAVCASSAASPDPAGHGAGLAAQPRPWQALRGALDEQHKHLALREGGWMHRASVDLGPVHRAMLARIGANTLLGPGAAHASGRRVAQGFERFSRKSGDTVPGLRPGRPGMERDIGLLKIATDSRSIMAANAIIVRAGDAFKSHGPFVYPEH